MEVESVANSGAEVGREGERENGSSEPQPRNNVDSRVPRKPQPSLTPNPCKCLKEEKGKPNRGGKGLKTDRLRLALGREEYLGVLFDFPCS